jgi:hypothetical protein
VIAALALLASLGIITAGVGLILVVGPEILR